MIMPRPPYYITTPIYYVNDVPHIGHAYTSLAADVLARFKRLDGFDVKFLTGTDEHGQKIAKAAANAGIAPKDFCDQVSANFRELTHKMNYSNDDFIRTTEPRHYKSAQALWDKLIEKGAIYLGSYAGWYAVRDEAYYGEDELTETAGRKFAPSGAECEWVEEASYFFKLSDYGDKLLEFYNAHPDFIAPTSRRNEVMSFVKGGLKDLSVSRTTFDWGIPIPNDPTHVMYVWLDALTNYITALGYPEMDGEMKTFWPEAIHLVGKDILRFHAVYWPAFLMAADLPPPRRVFAHGWWTIEGQKMSKSLGNVIAPAQLVEGYGLDQTRYFLLREVPFGQDGDFSHAAMLQRINSDLSNNLGNLAQRTLSFIAKNLAGAMPQAGELQAEDKALLQQASGLYAILQKHIDTQEFHRALEAIWALSSAANVYIDEQAPWSLKKQGQLIRMNTVLFVLCEAIRHFGLYLQPFMPQSAEKILNLLAIPADARDFTQIGDAFTWPIGHILPTPEPVFPRVEN